MDNRLTQCFKQTTLKCILFILQKSTKSKILHLYYAESLQRFLYNVQILYQAEMYNVKTNKYKTGKSTVQNLHNY